MACNQSFDSSTDAITHDSDPRLLRFVEVSTDPTQQTADGVETDIGTVLDMGKLDRIPTPASPGPVLNDLTGGISGGSAITLGALTDGVTHVTLAFTDSSTIEADLCGVLIIPGDISIPTLAVAQGKDALSDATISFATTGLDIASAIGKTLDSISLTITSPYGPTGLVKATSTFKAAIAGSGTIGGPFPLLDGNSAVFGPGLGIVIGVGDDFRLRIQLDGFIATVPNAIRLTLLGPPPPGPAANALTAGAINVTLTLDDLSTLTLTKDLADLHLEGNSLSDWIADFGEPGIIPAGRSVIYITGTTGLFMAPGLGEVFVYIGTTGLGPDRFGSFVGGQPIAQALNEFFPTGDVSNYRIVLLGTAVPFFVDVPIDASSLQSFATPTQLAEQNNPSTDPVILDIGNGELIPFIGDAILDATFTTPFGVYGPAMPTMSNASSLRFNLNGNPIGRLDSINDSLTETVIYVQNGAVVSRSTSIELFFDLLPESVPEFFAPNIMTEPYELRHRNLPAFHFRTIGPFPDTEARRYQVAMFVSQGPVPNHLGTGVLDRNWDWTQIAVQYFDTFDTVGMPRIESIPAFLLDNTNPVLALPDAYKGYNVLIPQGGVILGEPNTMTPWSQTGPWNYVRFLIMPTGGDDDPFTDYTGWLLQIVANAREVI